MRTMPLESVTIVDHGGVTLGGKGSAGSYGLADRLMAEVNYMANSGRGRGRGGGRGGGRIAVLLRVSILRRCALSAGASVWSPCVPLSRSRLLRLLRSQIPD